MDYTLAALKLLCVQLRSARKTSSRNAFSLGGILFQRAWLQGILVSTPSDASGSKSYILDDGTGVIELSIPAEFVRNRRWVEGMYVMVVGVYLDRDDDLPIIKVHKIIDLSSVPDRGVSVVP